MALMALRECLPSNMLYIDGASTMRNFVFVVAWHGGSPRVSTNCIDPRGSTLSLENPLKWAFTWFKLPSSNAHFVKCQREDDVGRAFIIDQDPMDCFIGHDDPYHQRVIMGVLEAF